MQSKGKKRKAGAIEEEEVEAAADDSSAIGQEAARTRKPTQEGARKSTGID